MSIRFDPEWTSQGAGVFFFLFTLRLPCRAPPVYYFPLHQWKRAVREAMCLKECSGRNTEHPVQVKEEKHTNTVKTPCAIEQTPLILVLQSCC